MANTTTIGQSIGSVVRDGVRIAYEVAGDGDPPIALLPAWTISNRSIWSALWPLLRHRHRVIAYDGRGTGESDRPIDPAAYDVAELVADGSAVLDAAGLRRPVIVGNSLGGLVAYLLAARRSKHIAGLVLIGASVNVIGGRPSALEGAIATFDEPPERLGAAAPGWDRYNRRAWQSDFDGFVRWFIDTALGGSATAEARAQGVAAGLDVGPTVLAATVVGRAPSSLHRQALMLRAAAETIRCPVLIITGGQDAIVPPAWGEALAWLLTADHVVLPEAAHCPQVTHPDRVADLITTFIEERVS